jgi:DNA processing protein
MLFMQISKLNYKSSLYPKTLFEISHPPKQLFVLGKLSTGPAVAIVGSRNPTEYGRQTTYDLAYQLAQAGVCIVSGLAYGIDAIAHQAAVDAKAPTIAVLGCGLDRIYPAGHRQLALKILEHGALVSEHSEGTPALRHHFPARNRIIAGLGQAIIVTEANASSGALITANFALEQNRLVMAVPGNITSPRSAGPNNLIKAGAIPVTDSSDVLAALDLEASSTKPVKADSKEEALLLELMHQGAHTSQQLIEQSGLTASQFANIISLMEISGKVRNLGAGQWMSR